MIGILALLAAAAATTEPSPYMLDAATVAMVDCAGSSGTAVHLGSGEYVTAAHVVHGETKCTIGGKPVRIEHINVLVDWALIHSDAVLPYRVVWNCDRLRQGQNYFATGYSEGNPWPVTTRLIGYGTARIARHSRAARSSPACRAAR